jgi:hypothetical protein
MLSKVRTRQRRMRGGSAARNRPAVPVYEELDELFVASTEKRTQIRRFRAE